VVCNAGPLIHLDQLSCLDLFGDLAPILVPDAVWDEVRRHRPQALAAPSVRRITAPPLRDPEAAALRVAFSLDAGESECLSLLLTNEEPMFLTDDAAARLVAERLGYRVHGTIGIVVRGIRTAQRTAAQVIDVLTELPQRSTLFIKRSLLDEIIVRIRQASVA
jgi:predicted nucleic acid-binding protein